MAESVPQKIVIRTYAPARRWIVGGILGFAAVLASYLLFEFGRNSAGFDGFAALRRESGLEAEIRKRDAAIQSLDSVRADLATLQAGQARERSELARTIGELQAQVARQSQELAFYKGIVVQGANSADVKVQQFRIAQGSGPGRYVIRVTLVQPGRPESIVAGVLSLVLEGQKAAVPVKLDLATLTAGRNKDLPYSFRYFESLSPEITVPDGFQPERLSVEVRSSRRGVAPVTQTFIWTVETV